MPAETPALSPSIARILLDESPKHAWTIHRLLGNRPRPVSAAQETGKIAHALLLEAGDEIEIIDAKDFRTNAAKEARDAARAAGRIPIVSAKVDEWKTRISTLRENLYKAGLNLENYESEVRVEWNEGDALCHGGIDLLSRDKTKIIDIKTLPTGRAHPELCAGRLLKSHGILQQEAYPRAIEQLNPELMGRVKMEFWFLELTDPYDVCPIECGGTMQEIAAQRWDRAVRVWNECMETGKWPGFGDKGPVRVEAPGWALAKELEADL